MGKPDTKKRQKQYENIGELKMNFITENRFKSSQKRKKEVLRENAWMQDGAMIIY